MGNTTSEAMNNTSKEKRLNNAVKYGEIEEVKALLESAGVNLEWKDEVSEIHIISELVIIAFLCFN